jgi:HNH endonuclease
VPRDFDVDHVNHNPSDNRPTNLRIVTRRDNAGNRRKALLSELVDLKTVSFVLEERAALEKQAAQTELLPEPKLSPAPKPVSKPAPKPRPKFDGGNPATETSFGGPVPQITYTGETKPAKYGGVWHKTNLGSWHLLFDRDRS